MAKEYLEHSTQPGTELKVELDAVQAGAPPSRHKSLKLPGMKLLNRQSRHGSAPPAEQSPQPNIPPPVESSETPLSPPLRKKSWHKVFRVGSGSNKASNRPVSNGLEMSGAGQEIHREPTSVQIPMAVTILLSNGHAQNGELSETSSYCTVPSLEHPQDPQEIPGEFILAPPSPMSEIIFQTQDDLEDVPEIPTPPADVASLQEVPVHANDNEIDTEELTSLLHAVGAHSDPDSVSVFSQATTPRYGPEFWRPASPRSRPAPAAAPQVTSNPTRSAEIPWFDYGLVLWALMMSFLAGYIYSCAS